MTSGCPLVNVPVLSNTTVRTDPKRSSASEVYITTPIVAPLPVPTMMAVGVARPMAHGQAITSTATILISARENWLTPESAATAGPKKNQPKKVKTAYTITAGTKTAETRSARRWMGALLP